MRLKGRTQHLALLNLSLTAGLSPSIQPVQFLLQSLPTFQKVNTPAKLGNYTWKLTEGALHPLIQIMDEHIKQGWPNTQPLARPLETRHQMDIIPFITTLQTSPVIN